MKTVQILFILFTGFFWTNTVLAQDEKTEIYSYDIETRLDDLGITLSAPSPPVANYVNVVQTGNLLFLAGKGPKDEEGNNIVGRLGDDMTIDEGYQAARRIGIAQLSVLKSYLGDLNKVKRVVKVLGMVKCTDDFTQQPQVVNGFSDLMVEVFGENGKHARAAVGMSALPGGICAEIEMIVEIE
ncbi:MAG: RidA family protein [Bacteroidota bacterium]